MKQRNSWFVAVALGTFCFFLSAPKAHAARHKKSKHKAQAEQQSSAGTQSSSSDDNTYVNVGKLGVGPSWDSTLVPLSTESGESIQMGTLDGRYWVNRRFGFDGGYGFGMLQTSPKSESLISFRAEGMFAIKESKHNIFYADVELMPFFTTGSGAGTSLINFQGGVGLEHAVQEISNLSIYTEWEPVSFASYSPGGGAASNTSFGFLGSVMNFTMGLRYYF